MTSSSKDHCGYRLAVSKQESERCSFFALLPQWLWTQRFRNLFSQEDQENRQWSIPLAERGAIHYPPFSLLSTFSSNLWCLKENLLSTFRFSFFHCVPHHASFNFPFWQQSLVKTKNLCEILLLKRPTVNLPFLKKKRQARLKKLYLWSNYYISGNELYRDQGWTEYLGKELLTQ